jgi:hypothetical protein
MLSKLKWFNLTLRALMEVGIVVALGYWGYRTGKSMSAKVSLSIGAPLLAFGFWGSVDFRQAARCLNPSACSRNWSSPG